MHQLKFTTKVLGTLAALRLEKHEVTQTLRSESHEITQAVINGKLSVDNELEILLDDKSLGRAIYVACTATHWEALDETDVERGGFDTLEDLKSALLRAGYRFRPMDEYLLYRHIFTWIEESHDVARLEVTHAE